MDVSKDVFMDVSMDGPYVSKEFSMDVPVVSKDVSMDVTYVSMDVLDVSKDVSM
jgi:hypothetical protein